MHKPALAAALAITATLTAVGCNRDKDVPPAASSSTSNVTISSAITSSSTPAHSPVNDKAKLCNLFSSRAQEFIQAINELQKATAQHSDWKWSESNISAAGDKVIDSVKNFDNRLKDTIGPEIPHNVADAMHGLAEAADDYSQAVEQRVNTSDELNNVFDALYKAEGNFDIACGFKPN